MFGDEKIAQCRQVGDEGQQHETAEDEQIVPLWNFVFFVPLW